MSDIVLNFYFDYSNIPFSTKNMPQLKEFISSTYKLTLEDVNELELFFLQNGEKKIIKNNLDLQELLLTSSKIIQDL